MTPLFKKIEVSMSFVESPGTEHMFPSITKLTTHGTGNCVVVGFLVAFLSIGTAELFFVNVAGICLRRLDVGFRVSSEIALKKKETTRLKKGHSTNYMHHTNKKTIKSQNRNKNTTELFTQA
jgi:hypothetical protein